MNPTFHQRKLKIFWHITLGSRGERFSGIVTGLLGVPRHNLTKCYKTALQNGPPTTDHESCSLHIKTCCFPFLISHMLLSIRSHLSFVLINISLITIDIEHFFKHVLNFWVFLSVKLCTPSVHFAMNFMCFSWGFPVFFSIVGMNSLQVLDVSNIFAQYVNFVYCILHSAGILHFDIVTFLSPYFFLF